MSRSHPRHEVGILVLLTLSLAACEGSTVAPIEPTELHGPAPGADLAISAPEVRAADLVLSNSAAPGGPLPTGPFLTEIPSEDALQIRAAKTTVGIYAGRAHAEGSHEYTGNLGRIETTVSLAFESQHVGSAVAVEQEWTWLPLSVWRTIRAIIGIDTDKTCGLTVDGKSRHDTSGAYFDMNKVREVPGTTQTSQANSLHQPACGHRVTDQTPAEYYDDPPAGMTCLYLITYDRDTYDIVDIELLGCSTSGTLI